MSFQNCDNSETLKIAEEDLPKRSEELNSKFSVFLNKKEKATIFGDGFNGVNEQNENADNPSTNLYGRSYLQKIKASSQRKYIKDEKYPSTNVTKPPLPGSSRTKPGIYTDLKKKTDYLEIDYENPEIFQQQNSKDISRPYTGRDRDSNINQSVNEFAFSLRNRKIRSKQEEIPEFIKQDMRIKLKSIATKIPLLKEQIHKILNEIIENKISLDNVRCKEFDKKSNLKEIKTLRNNAIADRIYLSKELDSVKLSQSTHPSQYNTFNRTEVKASTLNSGYNSSTINYNMNNYNSSYLNNDSDSASNELEQKISQLKSENSKFYENIDMLNEEIVENESINKNLKVHLKNWDRILDSLVKERNAARESSGKYNSNKKYGSII